MIFHVSLPLENRAQSPGTHYPDCTAHILHGKILPQSLLSSTFKADDEQSFYGWPSERVQILQLYHEEFPREKLHSKKEKNLAAELRWLYCPENSVTLVRDGIQFN